jgi:hypothetical protein
MLIPCEDAPHIINQCQIRHPDHVNGANHANRPQDQSILPCPCAHDCLFIIMVTGKNMNMMLKEKWQEGGGDGCDNAVSTKPLPRHCPSLVFWCFGSCQDRSSNELCNKTVLTPILNITHSSQGNLMAGSDLIWTVEGLSKSLHVKESRLQTNV